MKASNKIPLDKFVPHKSDVIMFDSNILIKLLYPVMDNTSYSAAYGNLYAKILEVGATLIISSIQISEFVNTCIRFQFELYKKAQNDPRLKFKADYRDTKDYDASMRAILDIIKNDIIPNFSFVDDGFKNMQKDNIFCYGFSYDFNDSILLEIAKQNNSILVTDDRDFGNYISDVKIVTSNKALLMFS